MEHCHICNKTFAKKFRLNEHILRAHGENRFFCSICGQGFNRHYRCANHLKKQHSNMPPEIFYHKQEKCPWCSVQFPKNSTMKNKTKHLAGCSKNPDKEKDKVQKFVCNQCGARFARKDNLNSHNQRKHLFQENMETNEEKQSVKEGWEKIQITEQDIEELQDKTLDPRKLFYQIDRNQGFNFKFGIDEENVTFIFSNFGRKLASLGYQLEVITVVLEYLIDAAIQSGEISGQMYISLDNPTVMDYPAHRKISAFNQLSIYGLLDEIAAILNSKQTLAFEGVLIFSVKMIKTKIQGQGFGNYTRFRSKQIKSITEYLGIKHGLIDFSPFVQNHPELENACFVICLAAALENSCGDTSKLGIKRKKWYKFKKFPQNILSTISDLYQEAKLPPYSAIVSDAFPIFQKIISQEYGHYQIVVSEPISPGNKGYELLYKGPGKYSIHKRINIIYHSGHFYLTDNLDDLSAQGKKLCEYCYYLIPNQKYHECYKVCNLCKGRDCFKKTKGKQIISNVFCDNCNRYFKSSLCKAGHNQHGICRELCRCPDCFVLLKREKFVTHPCGLRKCYHCKRMVPINSDPPHQCIILPPNPDYLDFPQNQIYIFLDFEAYRNKDGEHKANFVCLLKTCAQCIENFDVETETPCSGYRKMEFFGDLTIEKTVDYLFFDPSKKNAIVLCHNGGRYDAHFLLKCLTQRGLKPSVTCKGSQIIQLVSQNNVTVKDTFLFFRCALAKLPKMFKLTEETEKSFFPHLFNQPENYGYSGPIPTKTTFQPETMDEDRKKQFHHWYIERENSVWNFKQELTKYAWSDVLILHQACAIYRADCLDLHDLCPFFTCMTQPQFAALLFRHKYMDNQKYPLLLLNDNQTPAYLKAKRSNLAVKYLKWVAKNQGIQIDLEQKVGDYKVDGRQRDCQIVYEVNGCFWHACEKCFGDKMLYHHHDCFSYGDVSYRTKRKQKELENLGYQVNTIWECEIRDMLQQCPEMQTFFEDKILWRHLQQPIRSAREAYYGGRVEPAVLFCELSEELLNQGYSLGFKDYNSLYPYCMANRVFPFGRMEILQGDDLPKGEEFDADVCSQYLGLVKCYVVPPLLPQLLFPVLPYRHSQTSHLLFPLCKTCADAMNHETDCNHTKSDSRGWLGTFCTPELEWALHRGYRVEYIVEIWHFPEGCNEIFKPFIRALSKLKYSNSGYPQYCTTQVEKDEYLQQLGQKEGLHLESYEVVNNPGRRNQSKALLNSELFRAYGKFGQSGVKNNFKVKYLNNPQELQRLIEDPNKCLNFLEILSNEMILVQYSLIEEHVKPHAISNPIVASFVTCYARLHLLKTLEKLGPRVLYYDTDSVIYITKEGWPDLEESHFFGDFKNELHPGEIITSFVSLGPKTYAYLTNKNRTELKTKGIGHNWLTEKLVDYQQMRNILFAHLSELEMVYDKLEDRELAEKLKDQYLKLSKKNKKQIGTPNPKTIRGAATQSFIIVPDQRIKRNLKTATLRDEWGLMKIIRLNFVKRRLYTTTSSDPKLWTIGGAVRSIPWGWHWPSPPSPSSISTSTSQEN